MVEAARERRGPRGRTVPRLPFEEAARPHLPWFYSLARRLVGDSTAADDVAQRSLLKAFQGYGRLRDTDALPAWLKRILVNCCTDHLREEGRAPEKEPIDGEGTYARCRTLAVEDPLPYPDSLHLDFLVVLEVQDVWEVLGRIGPLYRVPLVLVHMEGYAVSEAADRLGVPRNTVLSRLHRGRQRFESELRRYAEEHGLLRDREGAVR